MIVEQPKAKQHEQRQGGGDERAAQEPFLFSAVHNILLCRYYYYDWLGVYNIMMLLSSLSAGVTNQIKSNQFDLVCFVLLLLDVFFANDVLKAGGLGSDIQKNTLDGGAEEGRRDDDDVDRRRRPAARGLYEYGI